MKKSGKEANDILSQITTDDVRSRVALGNSYTWRIEGIPT